jgi:SAM-dependent methyltransferase
MSWWADDAFWDAFAPYLFTTERVGQAAADAAALVKLLHINPGARVLDLCCGIGRHSVEFARLGHAVTAVDLTAAFLARARERAERENVQLELVHADMREFRRPDTFDAAVNLVTSFGYFEDRADDLNVARNLYVSLKSGARVAIEMLGKEILAREFVQRQWDAAPDGTLILIEHHLRSGWDWMDNRWIIIKGADELNFSHRVYSAAELGAVLRQSGFQRVEFFGTLAGAPYDHRAERLVAVATK